MASTDRSAYSHRPGRSARVVPRARGARARALARARRVRRVDPAPPGRPEVGLLRRAADRQRAARASTTSSRGCSRTSSRATGRCAGSSSSARAAGTATACRSSSRSRRSSASRPRTTSSGSGSPSSTPAAARRCSATSRTGTALTERIGFWIDLDDAYRTLDPDVRRVGLVGAQDDPRQGPAVREAQGRPVLPARPGDALEPRARPARRLPGRARSVGLRPPPGHGPATSARPARRSSCWSGRRRRGRWSRTPRWPSTRSSPTSGPGSGDEPRLRPGRGAHRARPRRRAPASSTASPARAARGRPPTSRRSTFIPGQPSTDPGATPCCPPTSSPRPTAPASSTPRSPSARTTSASASSTA